MSEPFEDLGAAFDQQLDDLDDDLGAELDDGRQTDGAGADEDDLDGQGGDPGDGRDDGQDPQETFIDPAQLPPEMQGHFRRMQASFTKARQRDRAQLKSFEQKAQLVDRFYQDPSYALQVIQQLAPHLGVQLTPLDGSPGPRGQGTRPAQANQGDLESEFQQELGSDLGFMARPLARIFNRLEQVVEARVKSALQPYERLTAQQRRETQEMDRERSVARMDSRFPGWEQHEADMQALDAFLRSGREFHPRFGSRQEALYALVSNGNGTARVAAVRDLSRTARRKTTTSRAGRRSTPNLSQQIVEAGRKKGWDAGWEVLTNNLDALERESQRGY